MHKAMCFPFAIWMLAGCSGEPGELPHSEPQEVAATTASPLQSYNNDPDLAAIMKTPGVTSWALAPTSATVAPTPAAAPSIAPKPTSTGSDFAVMTAKGHYRISTSPDALGAAFSAMYGPGGAPPGSKSLRGWSNGVDNRVPLTGSNFVIEVGPVFQSHNGANCSGTLIGERIVRTAAHCIVENSPSGGALPPSASNMAFFYDNPKGVNGFPAATAQATMYYYGGAYFSSGCGTSSSTNYLAGYDANYDACTWADWAFLILPVGWWSSAGSVSWWGYRGLGTGDVGLHLRMTGFPSCNTANAPANCVFEEQYDDSSSDCTVAFFTNGTAKFKTGCDTSQGDSGGPVWDPNTQQLIGHAQTEDCTTCSSSTTAPNEFLGHDDWLFNFENSLRSMYP